MPRIFFTEANRWFWEPSFPNNKWITWKRVVGWLSVDKLKKQRNNYVFLLLSSQVGKAGSLFSFNVIIGISALRVLWKTKKLRSPDLPPRIDAPVRTNASIPSTIQSKRMKLLGWDLKQLQGKTKKVQLPFEKAPLGKPWPGWLKRHKDSQWKRCRGKDTFSLPFCKIKGLRC